MIKYKRIIGGKTYNTETATKIFGYDGWDLDPSCGHEYGEVLYQTRHGAYFLYKYASDVPQDYGGFKDEETIVPLSPTEAQIWLEAIQHKDVTSLIEEHFGEMPEAGDAESRITLRMPDSLKQRIDALAHKNNQSTNAWIVRALERVIAYEKG